MHVIRPLSMQSVYSKLQTLTKSIAIWNPFLHLYVIRRISLKLLESGQTMVTQTTNELHHVMHQNKGKTGVKPKPL